MVLRPDASSWATARENLSPLTSFTGSDTKTLKIKSLCMQLPKLHSLKNIEEHKKSGRFKRCIVYKVTKNKMLSNTRNFFCFPLNAQGHSEKCLCWQKQIIEFHPLYKTQLKISHLVFSSTQLLAYRLLATQS